MSRSRPVGSRNTGCIASFSSYKHSVSTVYKHHVSNTPMLCCGCCCSAATSVAAVAVAVAVAVAAAAAHAARRHAARSLALRRTLLAMCPMAPRARVPSVRVCAPCCPWPLHTLRPAPTQRPITCTRPSTACPRSLLISFDATKERPHRSARRVTSAL